MSDFKVGDRVTPRSGTGYDRNKGRVVTHVGKKWVLYEADGIENATWVRNFESDFEKFVPFFERGKTYKYGSILFRVDRILTDSKGKAAVGFDVMPDGTEFATIRREFGHWTEF